MGHLHMITIDYLLNMSISSSQTVLVNQGYPHCFPYVPIEIPFDDFVDGFILVGEIKCEFPSMVLSTGWIGAARGQAYFASHGLNIRPSRPGPSPERLDFSWWFSHLWDPWSIININIKTTIIIIISPSIIIVVVVVVVVVVVIVIVITSIHKFGFVKKCIPVKLGHTLLLFQGQIRNPYYTHSTPCSFGGVYVPMFASQCPNSGQKPCGCFLKQWTPTTPTLFVKGGTNALGPQRIEPRWELGVEQLNHLNFRRIEILHGNHWNTQNNIRNTLKFRQFTAATRKKPRASCGSRGTLVQENLVLHIFWRSNIEDFWFNNTEMVCFLWLFTIINHPFVNGLYHLFMVIWGMVCYCFTITLDQIRWLVSFMTIWGTWKWDAEIISALKILMPGWHIYIHYMILIWYNYHISIKHVYGCLWIYDINRWTYINTYIYEYLNVEMHVNIYIYMVPCPVFPPPPWGGGGYELACCSPVFLIYPPRLWYNQILWGKY